MSDIKIDYRMTVADTDDDLLNPLTPRAGAVHSDEFVVATANDFGTAQPYLNIPRGRRGQLDILSGQTDTGGLSLRVLDAKVGTTGGNSERWVSAFVGDADNISQLAGLLVLVEERVDIDGTVTTADYFTGRIERITVGPKKNEVEFKLRDLAEDLSYTIFTGTMIGSEDSNIFARPVPTRTAGQGATVGYGSRPALAPLGLVHWTNHQGGDPDYGGFITTPWMKGTIETVNGRKQVVLDEDQTPKELRVITEAWPFYIGPTGSGVTVVNARNPLLRVRLKRDADSSLGTYTWGTLQSDSGSSVIDAIVDAIITNAGGQISTISKVPLEELDATDPDFKAASDLNNGDVVYCFIESGDNPSEGSPIYIDDVHPVQLFADILDGKWSTVNLDGTVRRSFPRDSASFSALISDDTFGRGRWIIEEPAKLNEWVEENICIPYQIGYRLNGSGEVVVFSTKRPTSASVSGVPTIGSADLDAATMSPWDQSREEAITLVVYKTESEIGPQSITETGHDSIIAQIVQDILEREIDPKDLLPVRTREHSFGVLLAENDNLKTKGVKTHEVELSGIHTGFSQFTFIGITFREYARRFAERHKETIKAFFSHGPITYKVTTLRTANTNGIQPGDWAKLQIPEQMNPADAKRGGLRVGLCTERTELGLLLQFTFLDGGPDSVLPSPTLNALTAGANPNHEVDVPIDFGAFAATQRVLIEYAVTETSVGTRPAEGSELWTHAATSTNTPAAGVVTVTIGDLPSNKRIWVRGRTQSAVLDGLPSAWVFPATTDRIDTAAYTAPSNLNRVEFGAGIQHIEWDPGNTDLRTVLELEESTCPGSSPERIALKPPGTEVHTIQGTAISTTYCLGVKHIDQFGGETATTTLQFTTAAALNDAPAMADLVIVFEEAVDQVIEVVESGLLLFDDFDTVGIQNAIGNGWSEDEVAADDLRTLDGTSVTPGMEHKDQDNLTHLIYRDLALLGADVNRGVVVDFTVRPRATTDDSQVGLRAFWDRTNNDWYDVLLRDLFNRLEAREIEGGSATQNDSNVYTDGVARLLNYRVRAIIDKSGADPVVEGYEFANAPHGRDYAAMKPGALTLRSTITDTGGDITGAFIGFELHDQSDLYTVLIMKDWEVEVQNLPTGWKARLDGGASVVESGGTATINVKTVQLPAVKVEVLDGSDVVQGSRVLPSIKGRRSGSAPGGIVGGTKFRWAGS